MAVLAAAAGLGALVRPVEPVEVVGLPAVGEVTAELLGDGTPVLISTLADGTVFVLEAEVPREPDDPLGALVGWCPRTLQYVEPHLGTIYDQRGRRYPIGIRSRGDPAQLFLGASQPEQDLVTRVTTLIEGRDRPDAPVRVGPRVSVLRTRGAPRPDPTTERRSRPPEWCRADRPPFLDLHEPDPVPVSWQMVDHGFLAGPARRLGDGRQLVSGTIVRQPSGAAWFCATELEPPATACPADVVPVSAFDGAPVASLQMWLTGPLLLEVADGEVVDVVLTPRAGWRGAGLVGVHRIEAAFEDFDLAHGLLHLSALPRDDVGHRCGGMLSREPLDVDARIDVAGVDDPLALAQLRPDAPIPVRVVQDQSTCAVIELVSL